LHILQTRGQSSIGDEEEKVETFIQLDEIKGIEKSHADKIIQPALQKGVDRAAKAKRDRIAKKLAEGARKHSGRRAR
jgi:hypothetical protein